MADLVDSTPASADESTEESAPAPQPTPAIDPAIDPAPKAAVTPDSAAEAAQPAPASAEPAEPEKPDARALFLEALRARLATANYGLSAGLGLSFSANGLLLLEADDNQEALRAASAALEGAGDDGRAWRFMGAGLDLDTGRYRAVVRITPLP